MSRGHTLQCPFKFGTAFRPANAHAFAAADYLTVWAGSYSARWGNGFNPSLHGRMLDTVQAQHGQNRSWGTRQVSSSQPQLLKCTVVTIKPHDRTPDDSNDALEVGPAEKEINIGAEQDNIAGPTPDGNGGGNDNGCNTVLARALVAGNEQPIADASVPQTEPDPYC